MKNKLDSFRVLKLTILFLGITLAISAQAHALLLCAHGNSFRVQNESIVSTYKYYGWGLDFEQDPGTGNWIHANITSVGEKSVQYIRIRLWTESADNWVSQFDVYNGSNKVKTITGDWRNGWHDVILNLETPIKFDRGICISIKTNVGVEQMGDRFIFTDACALNN